MKSWGRVARLGIRFGLVVLLALTAIVTPAAAAPASSSVAWRGEYYNNPTLSGAPALVRDDANINFDWGTGAPGSGVNPDYFSVRWTSYAYMDGGDYTFYATSDDGVRVWVDEQIAIDQWGAHPATTYSGYKSLSAGYHSIRMEYYDNTGQAVAKLWWERGGGQTITDWRGEYYNNTWLGGGPALVRNDVNLNFDWGYGSPAAEVTPDNFSVRWTKSTYFSSTGNYTFWATVDDGVRVWVDSALIIDRWYQQSRTTHTGNIYLTAGNHQVRVEYFEAAGSALCSVSWGPGGGGCCYQEVIVDDRDPGFVRSSGVKNWYSRNTGYGGHLYWTWNSNTRLYNWGKWYPYLPSAGNWEVYVFVASKYFGSKQAYYVVQHNGARDGCMVNQNNYYNQWISLGTYYFSGGGDEYVYLGDNTGEVYATRFLGYDAVKFVRRDGPGPQPPQPPQPQPTPQPPTPGCSITPQLGFGRVWNNNSNVRAKLGCPTEVEKSIWAGEELFQGGSMFWRQDSLYIYVLYNNGTWTGYPDTWTSSEPEWDVSIVAPAGYYQPKRGFGKVWRNNDAVRTGEGWATTEERGFTGSVQQFTNGLMFWSNTRGIFVLYNDGRWERYD